MKNVLKTNFKLIKQIKKVANIIKIAKSSNKQTENQCADGVCTVTWKPKAS